MKNALVVYESMFGATRQVAEAVADGLSRSARCTVVEVGDAPTVVDKDVDLLVIGAPTHAFGLSTPDTRHEAQKETNTPVISRDLGVREWLAALVLLSPNDENGRVRYPRETAVGTRVGGAQDRPLTRPQGTDAGAGAGLVPGRRHHRPSPRRRARPGAEVGRRAGSLTR